MAITVFNQCGDGVNIFVYCNQIHGDKPTEMTPRKPRETGSNPPEYLKEGDVFTCPVCYAEVVVVST